MDAIHEAGRIVLAGPLDDGTGSLIVLRVRDEQEARDLLAPDPWCSGGRDILRVGDVRAWTIFLEAMR